MFGCLRARSEYISNFHLKLFMPKTSAPFLRNLLLSGSEFEKRSGSDPIHHRNNFKVNQPEVCRESQDFYFSRNFFGAVLQRHRERNEMSTQQNFRKKIGQRLYKQLHLRQGDIAIPHHFLHFSLFF